MTPVRKIPACIVVSFMKREANYLETMEKFLVQHKRKKRKNDTA